MKKSKNLLELIPVKKYNTQKIEENGNITILYPKFDIFIFKWMEKLVKDPYIRIKLDKIGTKVWESIDGIKTVYDIGKEVSNKIGEKDNEEWYRRIGLFMIMLRKRDLIILKDKKQGDKKWKIYP